MTYSVHERIGACAYVIDIGLSGLYTKWLREAEAIILLLLHAT